MMKIYIFAFLIPILLSHYAYDSSKVIEYLSQSSLDEYYYRVIKRSFALIFADAYAYNEIAVNPPQPNFDNNYFQKVDIQKSIYAINQTHIDVYKFYQELKKRIADIKDLQFKFKTEYKAFKILNELFLACPIDFTIKKTNEKPELFCIFNEQFMKLFPQNVTDEIKANLDCPIDSINGKDPFDYIAEFGGNINAGKNLHSTLSNKFNTHNGESLATYPLNEEDLYMEINFKNGKKVNFKYVIISQNQIGDLNDTLISEIEYKKEEKKEDKDIQWEVTHDLFKCKVDNGNQANIFYLHNSNPSSEPYDNYEGNLINCIDLFDQNNYPIIVIFGKNVRYDAPHLPKYLVELISPLISMKYYKADKIHEVSLEKIPIEYGVKNFSYYKVPIDLSYELNEKLIEKRKTLKNKRKPTDILIYTDGNLVSVDAVFMKSFQYYGAGIVAGYFGNPNKNNVPFDSAQSCGIFINQKAFEIRSSRGYGKELVKRYSTIVDMPYVPMFFGDFDFHYPIEYSVLPVDERVEIFEYLKGSNYQMFIDEAKKILEKYKNQCNPKNKKLVLVNNECDNKFGNEYTHGGYECGDDGKWTNNCVPSYCDPGYVFNYKENKCVSIMEKVDFSSMVVKHVIKYHTKESLDFWTIFPIISIIFILGIIYYYTMIKKNKKNVKTDENEEELVSIEE